MPDQESITLRQNVPFQSRLGVLRVLSRVTRRPVSHGQPSSLIAFNVKFWVVSPQQHFALTVHLSGELASNCQTSYFPMTCLANYPTSLHSPSQLPNQLLHQVAKLTSQSTCSDVRVPCMCVDTDLHPNLRFPHVF